MEKQKPERKFSVGSASATVWANERVVNGKQVVIKSVQLAREYQDKETGDWRRSNSYSARELREQVEAACQAYEYVTGKKLQEFEADDASAGFFVVEQPQTRLAFSGVKLTA